MGSKKSDLAQTTATHRMQNGRGLPDVQDLPAVREKCAV